MAMNLEDALYICKTISRTTWLDSEKRDAIERVMQSTGGTNRLSKLDAIAILEWLVADTKKEREI